MYTPWGAVTIQDLNKQKKAVHRWRVVESSLLLLLFGYALATTFIELWG